MTDLAAAKIGYVPYSASLAAPGDRRRFVNWARARGVPFELPHPGRRYDLVVLASTSDISKWARHPHDGTRIIYDLVDSYLAVPAWSAEDVARGLGKTFLRQHARLTPSYTRAVVAMCRRADAVLCSTPEQRTDIERYCPDVRVVLDVHDDELRAAARVPDAPGQLRLFWEGLPQNLAGIRPVFASALEEVGRHADVSLHVATDPSYRRWFGRVGTADTHDLLDDLPVPTTLHPWDLASLGEVAARCDAGVIPLDLGNRFAVGKPENKLLIMWQLGLPVAASATPAYVRTMRAAGADLTCTTKDDWVRSLLQLTEPAFRQSMASAGADYVRREHSGEQIRQAWDRVVTDVLTAG